MQVDLLKHGIPDPSVLTSSASQDKENKNEDQTGCEDYISDLCFVHTRWALAIAVILLLLIKGNHMLISMLMNNFLLWLFFYYFLLKNNIYFAVL